MSEILENCLTCWRKTNNFIRFSDDRNDEDVGTIVESYFWFQVDQYKHRVLCTSCWEKIKDFHKFYCEVKQLWNCNNVSGSDGVIKTERSYDEDGQHQELMAYDLLKVEITNKEYGDSVIPWNFKTDEVDAVCKVKVQHDSETTAEDSEEDSSVPIAERYRCAKERPTDSKKDKSFRLKRKQSNSNKKDSKYQCELCDPIRKFKYKEGLEVHKVVYHAENAEKKFQCDQCEKAFANEWQLSGHKHWHQKQHLNIHCALCNKYFDSGRTLNYHIQANHTEQTISSSNMDVTNQNSTDGKEPANCSIQMPPPSEKRPRTSEEDAQQQDELIRKFCTFICDKCGYAGENFYNLEKHYKINHEHRGYAICCGRKFYKKRQLYEHCQRHVNPDAFQCEVCKKSFTDSEGLEKHSKWVHMPDSEKPFKCEICDAAFFKQYLLKNHMKYHLSVEQKLYNCEECDRSFGAPSYLRTHQQTVHGAVSRWVCDICAKGFPHRSLFESHRLTHTKEGASSLKRQCDHCKKWLKNKSTYRRHLSRCLAGGPVTCDLCGKEVANEHALVSHKRFNHTEQPLFTCSYCGKQFKRAIRHKEHEANHRGEVLYSCPFCPYTCNSNSNMYTHKKAAHAELWAEKIAERFYKR